MKTLTLLLLVTACYAAYNLLVKASSSHVASGTTPILATISLQVAALSVSIVYLLFFLKRHVPVTVPGRAYAWAILAGTCIGLAEILYFYLFRGFAGEKQVAASTAIPFVVGGTIVVTVIASLVVFHESLNPMQWFGVALAFTGMVVLAVSSA